MTNLKPVDVAIVGGGWSGLAMAKEITTRSGLNVVVLEKKLRPDMQLLIVEGATHGRPGDQRGILRQAQARDELRKFLASHSAHLDK